MHKLIVEDSTQCFTAMPDYMIIMTKRGDNEPFRSRILKV